jgi:hypothetical protein
MVAIAALLDGEGDRLQRAAMAALSTRVELKDEEGASLESLVSEIIETVKKN